MANLAVIVQILLESKGLRILGYLKPRGGGLEGERVFYSNAFFREKFLYNTFYLGDTRSISLGNLWLEVIIMGLVSQTS